MRLAVVRCIVPVALLALPLVAAAQVRNLHSTFGDDPRSQMTLSWAGGTSSSLRFGTTPSMAQSALGTPAGIHHHVALSGLLPDTLYYYEVGGDSLATGSFTTAPNGNPEFVFAVPGDVQGSAFSSDWQNQSNFFGAMGSAFQLPVGDLVQEGQEQAQWDDSFYGSSSAFTTSVPLTPIRGNHERYSLSVPGNNCDGIFLEQFRFPNNPAGASYFFEYGDALFVIIDSYCGDADAERAWLTQVLANNTKKWIFAFLHPPIYSTGGHGGADLEGSYNAILEAYDVNVVFSGHAHTMSVNHPIHENAIVPSYADGVLYFNTAGTNYNSDRDDKLEAKPFQSYLQPGDGLPMATLVTVRDDEAVVETYNYETGETYHALTLPPRTSRAGSPALAPTLSPGALGVLVALFGLCGALAMGAGKASRTGAPRD